MIPIDWHQMNLETDTEWNSYEFSENSGPMFGKDAEPIVFLVNSLVTSFRLC